MEPDQPLQRSYLFTIRLWTEPMGDGDDRVERRGRAQYVVTGERCSFRDWLTLVAFLEAKLQELDGERAASNVTELAAVPAGEITSVNQSNFFQNQETGS